MLIDRINEQLIGHKDVYAMQATIGRLIVAAEAGFRMVSSPSGGLDGCAPTMGRPPHHSPCDGFGSLIWRVDITEA
jgi:hypothetical protein